VLPWIAQKQQPAKESAQVGFVELELGENQEVESDQEGTTFYSDMPNMALKVKQLI